MMMMMMMMMIMMMMNRSSSIIHQHSFPTSRIIYAMVILAIGEKHK